MVNSGKFLLYTLFLVVLLAAACTPREASSPAVEKSVVPARPQTETSVRESWDLKWEKTLQAARKEGKVVAVASSQAPALKEAIPILKKKYGIDLDVISGRAAELTPKILRERSAGIFSADIFFAGMNSAFTMKQQGIYEPVGEVLMLPDVADPKVWFGEALPFADKERYVINFVAHPTADFGINTNLVKSGELKSHYDLLDARWKGKLLVNDPTLSGIAFVGFSTLVYNKILNLDFFRQLAATEPMVLRDERLQVDWLARGRYPVLLWPRTGSFAEYRNAGVTHIDLIAPKEGQGLSGTAMALLNRAPNPNAAKIFINWFLTKEGQMIQQKIVGKQSARLDTGTEGVDPLEMRRPGEKYFIHVNNDEQWVMKEQDRYMELAQQIFSPLLK